jgi:eukaryotic-like serine/threonine-protein kinase
MEIENHPLQIGKKALSKGILTSAQLQQAIVEYTRRLEQNRSSGPSFDFFLLSRGYVTPDQLALLHDEAAVPAPAAPKTPEPAPPPPTASTGAFGKFIILGELGRGGMGEVVEALDPTLGRRVAIKRPFIRSRYTASPMEQERFLREAQLAVALPRHPHLVQVHESGRIGGQCYIAMELVSGRTMAEWKKTATFRQEMDVLRQVAEGVHHAHEHGIIHRDLKPANIMIRTDGRAVVTDFGLAKSDAPDHISLTPFGFMVGSPGYMSPEQARCLKNVDRRTDVYSLGVMVYEALTGRKPFEGRSAMEILLRMVQDSVRRPTEILRAGLNPVLYEELETVCLQALHKDPTRRHQTAKAFAEDVARALECATSAVSASTTGAA